MDVKRYVANLAKYNEGKLAGEWLTLPKSREELEERLQVIMGEDEEYTIHDTMHHFISESMTIYMRSTKQPLFSPALIAGVLLPSLNTWTTRRRLCGCWGVVSTVCISTWIIYPKPRRKW